MRKRAIAGFAVPLCAAALIAAGAASAWDDPTGSAGPAARTAKCDGVKPTLEGTKADDKLKGTGGDDVISAGPGNDSVKGKGGNDLLCGGPGKDRLKGAAGDDRIFGAGGKDSLNGGPGTDACDGGPAKNKLKNCEEDGPPPVNANDAPTDIGLSNDAVDENQPAGTVVGVLSTSDEDAGATHSYALAAGFGDTDNGKFKIVGDELHTAQGFDFETTPTASVRIRSTDNGALFFEEASTITIANRNDAPVADDEAVDAIGNTTLVADSPGDGPPSAAGPKLTIAEDVLAGDTDEDGNGSLAVQAGTFFSDDGGTVTIEGDGDFVYTPAAGTSCTDTSDFFEYTLTDQNATKPPGTPATDVGRVDVTITDCGWYVSNNAAGNSGTSSAPFDTLAQAETASGANHFIFVFDGDNTTTGYNSGIALKAGQRLVGESADLVVGGQTLHTANAGGRPSLTAFNEDVVALDDSNTIAGLGLDPAGAGGGIAGGAGDTGGVQIDDVRIADTGTVGSEPGLGLENVTGLSNVSDFVANESGTAVSLINAGTVQFLAPSTISITTSGGPGLVAVDTGFGTSTFDEITASGSVLGGVKLLNTTSTGPLMLGDQVGTDLALTTTAGATPAFSLTGHTGNVLVDGGGSDTVSSTDGAAIEVVGTTSTSPMNFDHVSASGSLANGILLNGFNGALSAAAGSLVNSQSAGVAINGGNGDFTYGGLILDDTGQLVSVSNSAGGTKDFDGSIFDGDDGDGSGISLSSNAGSTVRFDGGLALSTGANPAFSATGGGTVVVSDPASGANTITTTTGRALNVVGTNIGAGDLTFERISANGAPQAVLLNSTGTDGNLAVTGNGGTCTVAMPACTGGDIASTTGDAISLTNTSAPSFTRVNVHDAAGNGLLASGVSGIAIADSIFVDNSDDIATSNEGNLRLHNLTGTSSVTNSVFREARVNEIYWTPTSGSATMDWTGNTVGPDNGGELGSGFLLNPTGTATVDLNVSGGSFTGLDGDSLRPAGSDQSAMDVSVAGGTQFTDSNSGVNFSVDEDADLTFDVNGSTFLRHSSHALQMIVNDDATSSAAVSGQARNNTIGDGTPDSGSRDANGISYDLEGNADIVLEVVGNTVRNTDTQGIFIQSVRFPSGTLNPGPTVDLTLRDNAVSQIDDDSGSPFGFQHGTQIEARRNSTMCMDIAGNSSTGIGGAEHFRVRQRNAATFQLERFAGDGADDALVATFIAGQNDAGSTGSATDDSVTGFTGVADSACENIP